MPKTCKCCEARGCGDCSYCFGDCSYCFGECNYCNNQIVKDQNAEIVTLVILQIPIPIKKNKIL